MIISVATATATPSTSAASGCLSPSSPSPSSPLAAADFLSPLATCYASNKRFLALCALSGVSVAATTAAIFWLFNRYYKRPTVGRPIRPEDMPAELQQSVVDSAAGDASAIDDHSLRLNGPAADASAPAAEPRAGERRVTQDGGAETLPASVPLQQQQQQQEAAVTNGVGQLSLSEEHPLVNKAITTTTTTITVSHENAPAGNGAAGGYKNSESPLSTTNSEGSADSGRATGGLTSCSPFESAYADMGITPYVGLYMYEFELPNTLVGLVIGVKGKTIKELCQRTGVKMLIRPHHTAAKFETHQICSVEGKRDHINRCLHLIRHRFPQTRFPDLNLKPVLPPPIPPPPAGLPAGAAMPAGGQALRPQPTPLTLPVGVPCEVYISAPVDAGHFFVQLPTHPTFQSLQILDFYMLQIYSSQMNIPELPKPCRVGVLCAAPAYNGWFRAITLHYDDEQDESLVRFVDYGGFAKIPRADLRQIRTDFMSLPLQAVECYLANVQPVDGTSHWSDEASELFNSMCVAKIIQAEVVGYNKADTLPCVELYVVDEHKKVLKVDAVLLQRGLAKPADPTRTVGLPKMAASPAAPKITLNDQPPTAAKHAPATITAPPPPQQFTQPPPSLPPHYKHQRQQQQKSAVWKALNSTA